MRLPLIIATVLLSGTFWSCSQRLTAPQSEGVTIRLQVGLSADSGDPQHPIDVTATATNRGPRTVYHPESCWMGAVWFEVLDPSGASVSWFNPLMIPLCPDACCVPLETGKSTGSTIRFDGRLFTREGTEFQAPAGDYTVLARFEARTERTGGALITVERRVGFRWNGTTSPAIAPS